MRYKPLIFFLNFLFNVQGVLLSVPEAMEDLVAMKRLWIHEVLRVYYDRLVDDSDRSWIVGALRQVTTDQLEEDFDAMFQRLATTADTATVIMQKL